VVECLLVDDHGQLAPADLAVWRSVLAELGSVEWGAGNAAKLASPLRPSALAEHLRAEFVQPLGLDVSSSAVVTVRGNRVEVVLSPR
jgi:hypothetical protein